MVLEVKVDYSVLEKRIKSFSSNFNNDLIKNFTNTGQDMLDIIRLEDYQVLQSLKATQLKGWARQFSGLPYFSENKGLIEAYSDNSNIKIFNNKKEGVDFGFGNMPAISTMRMQKYPLHSDWWWDFEFSEGPFRFGSAMIEPVHILTETFLFYKENIKRDVKLALKKAVKE
jgi:hypothetical protein